MDTSSRSSALTAEEKLSVKEFIAAPNKEICFLSYFLLPSFSLLLHALKVVNRYSCFMRRGKEYPFWIV